MNEKELLTLLKKHLVIDVGLDVGYSNTYLDIKLSWVDQDSIEREKIEICSTSCNLGSLND